MASETDKKAASTFGLVFRLMRERRGLSLARLALEADTSASTLYRWEQTKDPTTRGGTLDRVFVAMHKAAPVTEPETAEWAHYTGRPVEVWEAIADRTDAEVMRGRGGPSVADAADAVPDLTPDQRRTLRRAIRDAVVASGFDKVAGALFGLSVGGAAASGDGGMVDALRERKHTYAPMHRAPSSPEELRRMRRQIDQAPTHDEQGRRVIRVEIARYTDQDGHEIRQFADYVVEDDTQNKPAETRPESPTKASRPPDTATG